MTSSIARSCVDKDSRKDLLPLFITQDISMYHNSKEQYHCNFNMISRKQSQSLSQETIVLYFVINIHGNNKGETQSDDQTGTF